MAKQFSITIDPAQKTAALAGVQFDEEAAVSPDAVQITSWLSRLHLLYGIPFHYLVPDIRMVPDESIRFFQVDENWISALIDGAYSPGTSLATDTVSQALQPQLKASVSSNLNRVRAGMLDAEPGDGNAAPISGFFLRSAAVSGWPGMEVLGYADVAGNSPLGILRLERVSPSLLLCLFSGSLARVDFRTPSEGLIFDFDLPDNRPETVSQVTAEYYQKSLRYVNSGGGVSAGDNVNMSSIVSFRDSSKRVIAIDSFASLANAFVWAPGTPSGDKVMTSAEFALVMVQEIETVSFQLNA